MTFPQPGLGCDAGRAPPSQPRTPNPAPATNVTRQKSTYPPRGTVQTTGASSTPGVKPIDFAQWLAGVKPRISKATWRAYKQAGLWIIEHWPDATVDLVERADA